MLAPLFLGAILLGANGLNLESTEFHEGSIKAHPGGSRMFFKCKDGKCAVKFCPIGETFDLFSGGCRGRPLQLPSETCVPGVRVGEGCRRYRICLLNRWVKVSCPVGEVFDGQLCRKGSCRRRRDAPQCGEGHRRRVEGECAKYTECVDGKVEVKTCPVCQNFDDDERMCRGVFHTACPSPAPPVPADPTTTPQPTTAEPTTATQATVTEPSTKEATTAEPTTAESTSHQSTATQATVTEPSTKEATTAEPTTAESTSHQSTATQATVTEPSTKEATKAEPSTAESTSHQSTATQATVTEPSTKEATKAEPSTAETTDSKPHKTQSTTNEPTSTIQTSDKPSQTTSEPAKDSAFFVIATDTTCIDSEKRGIPGDCRKYLKCVDGKFLEQTCSWWRYFDSLNRECTFWKGHCA